MEPAQNVNKQEISVLYGSQTGQAEAIANEILEAAVFESYNINIYCLKDEGKKFDIKNVKCAIFVCSTTGDGDPPENARKFIRTIGRKTVSKDFLAHLHYALLGLGDTNYSTFCGGPKRLEKELKAHGATSFYPTAFADDAVGLEEVVEPWIDGLLPALKSYINACNFNCSSTETKLTCENKQPICRSIECDLETVDSESVAKNISKLEIDCNSVENFSSQSTTIENVKFANETDNCIDLVSSSIHVSPILKSTKLSLNDLSLPPLISYHFDLQLEESNLSEADFATYQNGAAFPVASSDIFECSVKSARQLSSDDAVKRALELKINFEDSIDFQPGDSFAICCVNDKKEVNWLLNRLSLEKVADVEARLRIRENVTKKSLSVPSYIPEPFTIRYVISTCLEIRSVPKKQLLRALVECTSKSTEKRRLEELCSKQGAAEYLELIRGQNISFLDVLATFQSCKPSFELLVQHLPRLQPRRYSVTNSPLIEPKQLTFVFNVVRFDADQGRVFRRNGVCTGLLEQYLSRTEARESNVQVVNETSLKIFKCKSTGFQLPDDASLPIVMIGPGTGVAPFLGFLEHRAGVGGNLGESWLFYGCRHKQCDFLYEEKLRAFEKDGILSRLLVAFSRDSSTSVTNPPRYVQDNLRLHKTAVVDLLLRRNAIFYVCGDARNMAKGVRQCVIELIASETECDQSEASGKFKQVILEKRYREDIWT